MQLGMGAVRGGDVAEWLSRVQLAEELGFGMVGVGDDPSLGVAAYVTERVRVGPMVTTAVTRHPKQLVKSISAVHQISGGRAVLGLGRGFSDVMGAGEKPATTKQLEDAIVTLRSLLRGEDATWKGNEVAAAPAVLGPDGKPAPVWLSAYGPKTMEVAGAVADGVVIASAADPQSLRHAIDIVRGAAKDAGRAPEDVEIWCMVRFSVRDTFDEALLDVKANLASGVQNIPRDDPHISDEIRAKIDELRSRYEVRVHAQWQGSNADELEELGLSEFAVERLGVVGTPDQCRAKLLSLVETGVDGVYFSGSIRDPANVLRRVASEVAPELMLS